MTQQEEEYCNKESSFGRLIKARDLALQFVKSFGFIIFIIFVSAEYYFLDKRVVPHVKKALMDQKLLREEIRVGRFIVTEEDEFAKNNSINSKYIKELNSGAYSIKNIQSIVQNNITSLKDQLNQLSHQINDLKENQKALLDGFIEVKVFRSTKDSDKNDFALNAENPTIAALLKNGSYHHITTQSEVGLCMKIRLDTGMTVREERTAKAVGRIYAKTFDTLFKGSSQKHLGKISIQLQERDSCN